MIDTGDLRKGLTLDYEGRLVKVIDFAPAADRLAAAIAADTGGSAVIDVATALPAAHVASTRGTSRLAYLADGTLWGVHYGPGLSRWDQAGARTDLASPTFIDAAVDHDRRGLTLVTADGAVWRLRDGALREVLRDPGAIMVAGAATDDMIVTGHTDGVRVHDLVTGATRWLTGDGSGVTDVAVTADGALVLAGTRAGTIEVWTRTGGTLRAVLRGHRQRLATVELGADGVLVSASWDGSVLLWDLTAMTASPDEVSAAARRAWGIDPTEAVRGWRR